MTDYVPQPNAHGLVRLTGTIRNLKVVRSSASFVLTANDQSKLGILAVASALAGLDGQAATASHSASDLEEAADYLEFDLGREPVKGWVWRSPFKEGDTVFVAAEKAQHHWEAFGISRPSDRTVALYPHCSRGRIAHYKNAFKWWLLGGGGVIVFIGLPFGYFGFREDFFTLRGPWVVYAGLMIFFGVMTFFLTRKWLPFVRVAEKVFGVLGLSDPASIDLGESSKRQRKPSDPGGFGTFYFRY